MNFTPFNPPPDQLEELIHDICDAHWSLAELARKYKTSLSALSIYLTRPEVQEHLQTIQSAGAIRARHTAINALPYAVNILGMALQEYYHEACNVPYKEDVPSAREQRRRSRETARRAASLLFRICTFDPARPRKPARTPGPQAAEPQQCANRARPPAAKRNPTITDLAEAFLDHLVQHQPVSAPGNPAPADANAAPEPPAPLPSFAAANPTLAQPSTPSQTPAPAPLDPKPPMATASRRAPDTRAHLGRPVREPAPSG